MLQRMAHGLGIAALALAGLVGASAVTAQTTAPSASLYVVRTGLLVGSASVALTGTTMQATVNLQGGLANTTYAICVTDPLLEAQVGGCNVPDTTASAACFPILTPNGVLCAIGVSIPTADALGALTTTAAGSGTATVTIPQLMPVVIIVVTIPVGPGDSARAVVNTGATPIPPFGSRPSLVTPGMCC